MRTVETIAVVFGIVAVWFNARQNVLGWATGLVNVGLYTFIFFRGQLYALMALQIFFFAISVYGWYQWLRGGERHTGVVVTRTPRAIAAAVVVTAIGGTAGLGWALDRYTADQQPYLDAGLSVVSMAAQWMMARKYLETWWIWIGVNLVSVPFFLFRGEYPTAFQYTVFLGLAVSGLIQWRRSLTAPA
ncbi:MAG: nicotinamide riboside transporter PnuC [Gemmatimonadales bacterium]|nr:nicotinamide riboside transporter PnuC [Gemmatimonadales bacterium]